MKWCKHWEWDKENRYFVEVKEGYPKRLAGKPYETPESCDKCGEKRPIRKRKLHEILEDEGFQKLTALKVVRIVNDYSAEKYED